jgi:ADP-heptose:LPS heptosyltransferase
MKVLCIQLKQLGDVLMTTAAVRALAQAYPGCQIDFITQKPAHTVFDNSPHVHQVYCVRWKLSELPPLLGKIKREKYDLLVDFSGSSKTAVFSWCTGIPRRIGHQSKNRSWCFTEAVAMPENASYAAERKLSLLSSLGITISDCELDFYLPPNAAEAFEPKARQLGMDQRKLIVVSPVSKRVYKVWAADRFAKICDRLIEQYKVQIFFLIGPGESQFADEVRAEMKQESLPVDESLSLYEAAVVLDKACCYVGNDNGLMHLSVARKRPTFGIFGRPLAKSWTSPVPFHDSIEFDPGCKSMCLFPSCQMECLSGISVESVWMRLESFLAQQTDC